MSAPIPTLERRTLVAPDGGHVALFHAGGGAGLPVILAPGMFDTRRVWLGVRGGLVAALIAAGFDPWVFERRTAGVAAEGQPRRRVRRDGPRGGGTRGGPRTGLDEVVEHDLPLIQRTVFEATGRPAAWVGHSYGGVLIGRAVPRTLDPALIWGAVLVSSSVDPPLLMRPEMRTLIRLGSVRGTLPTQRLRIGPANESQATMADGLRWAREFRRDRESSWSWDGIDVPLLGVVGANDRVTPPAHCARFLAGLGAAPEQLRIVGADWGRRVGHETVLVHEAVARDAAPLIADWLAAQVPAEAR
jgi:pimeloyl-ACP methyl ester carboxylesterase